MGDGDEDAEVWNVDAWMRSGRGKVDVGWTLFPPCPCSFYTLSRCDSRFIIAPVSNMLLASLSVLQKTEVRRLQP